MNQFALAIVGSRYYPSQKDVVDYVNILPIEERQFTVITGGAEGVDSWAEDAARKRGIPVKLFLPSDEEFNHINPPELKPLMRNEVIVAQCDGLVAFWGMDLAKDGTGSGTVHVMKLAMQHGKLMNAITPWGVIRPEVKK